jgi:hypothetical protein
MDYCIENEDGKRISNAQNIGTLHIINCEDITIALCSNITHIHIEKCSDVELINVGIVDKITIEASDVMMRAVYSVVKLTLDESMVTINRPCSIAQIYLDEFSQEIIRINNYRNENGQIDGIFY